MRGKKAKELRRQSYKDKYTHHKSRLISVDTKRKKYKSLKRTEKGR